MQTNTLATRERSERRARWLGHFSLALGASQCLAPGTVAKLIGLKNKALMPFTPKRAVTITPGKHDRHRVRPVLGQPALVEPPSPTTRVVAFPHGGTMG